MIRILLIISIFFLTGCDRGRRGDIAPSTDGPPVDSPTLASIIEGEWIDVDPDTGCITALYFSPESSLPQTKFSLSSLNLATLGTYTVTGESVDFNILVSNGGADCSGRMDLESGDTFTGDSIVESEDEMSLNFPIWENDHNESLILYLIKNDKKKTQ